MAYPPQPRRPKEAQFIDSAKRYIEDAYLFPNIYGLDEWHGLLKKYDESIIMRERDADGRIPGSEDLLYYALYQLARYQKARKAS